VALRRNRDFLLYQAGQLLSATGGSFSGVAYPLLTLALTHSPAKAGLVGFARLAPAPLLGLAAGVASDRFDRRRIMLAADAARAVTIGVLALVVWRHTAFWPIPLLAFAEGAGEILFAACSSAVLRSVVPPEQLPQAISVQVGRSGAVGVVGPPVGGALFALARALPFLADAVSYVFSFVALSLMRTRFQQARERSTRSIRVDLAEGFRYLWREPFLRTTAFIYAVGNVTVPAALFIVIVVARRDGLTGGEIGLLLAVFSACLLVGSLLSGPVRRRLDLRAVVLLESVSSLATVFFLVDPSVYVLVAATLPQAIAIPITDSYVIARRISATPDHLLGRVESVRILIARTATPLGPLVAGVLVSAASPRAAVAVFLAANVLLAAYCVRAPALRA
jgi:MFS family permease